jgi:xanthine dehydrogenase D subunit
VRSRASTTTAPPVIDPSTREQVRGVVGDSAQRPDGVPKVKGEFAYSSDLWAEGMLWGATVRSPHVRARITAIDAIDALSMQGVRAVLTQEDVPGRKTYGLEYADQPVLAWDEIRYQGEAVAIVAADHPETARRAAERVHVGYEELEPLVDPEQALADGSPQLHDTGNVIRHVRIRYGYEDPEADVVVTGDYEVGMQDQAFLGPESGMAVPAEDGGVDLFVSTQWLHVDRGQVAASLGLPEDKVRITLSGVGGAFGAREDLSIQIHCCMLALATGRPVKMMYSRAESFVGHVHRHPARMHYEHGATTDGKLVYVKARIILDGGAYASSSTAVAANAACFACGPYEVPSAQLDSYALYTNNPPCGAMRGFGAVQVCFAYESQMDRLAAQLGMDPVDLRIANAMTEASELPTGQAVGSPAPVAELLERVRAADMPPDPGHEITDLRALPGGVSNTTHGEGVRRGVGYAVGFKNVGYSEGFDDYATARVRLTASAGEPLVEVHTAAAEVGQGLNTVQVQVARTELGVENVVLLPADTAVGSSGSSSASRQTYMTGGAVKVACEAVRDELIGMLSRTHGDPGDLSLAGGKVVSESRGVVAAVADILGDEVIDVTREFRHVPTDPLDAETGRGNAHVQFAFAAHRAVVDVDTELGLVKVVELATAQDVGKAINPQAVEGQIEGGSAQGLGLALMEEIQIENGAIRNPSFTDYLIPTMLDMPPVRSQVLELADPAAPYGLRGVGEPPTISSTPAIMAALRAASGRPLTRVPVRPHDFVDLPEDGS